MRRKRRKICGLMTVLLCLVPVVLVAQQGHPLVGVWSGDWNNAPNGSTPVLIDMSWEDTTLHGTINPGFPDAADIEAGVLDSKNWTVHIEAAGTDRDGSPVRIVVDGKIDDLGSPNRTLTGTWTRNGVTGPFKLTRE